MGIVYMAEFSIEGKNRGSTGITFGKMVAGLWLSANILQHAYGINWVWCLLSDALFGVFMLLYILQVKKRIVRIRIQNDLLSLYTIGNQQVPCFMGNLHELQYSYNNHSLKIKGNRQFFLLRDTQFSELKSLVYFLENTAAQKKKYVFLQRDNGTWGKTFWDWLEILAA